MIKACIFDLDGTILDTIGTITYYVNFALQKHGIDSVSEDECKYFAGTGAKNLIRYALASKGIKDGDTFEKVFSDYICAYDNNSLYLTKPFGGIIEVLQKLKDDGIKLAVLSNKQDLSAKSVVEHFFGNIFDVVRGGIDGVPLKPDPTMAIEICSQLGVSCEEVCWVGDTSVDIETAKNLNAGLSIGVLWGFRKRDELEKAGANVIIGETDCIYREVAKLA